MFYKNEKVFPVHLIHVSKEKLLQMKNVWVVVFLFATVTVKAQIKAGQPAPEIALPDTKGNVVALSSLKGKVVLIDFWASWCGPCRAANPGVVRLYSKYKDKGFEVFGVSIDSEKDKWLKAIQHDRIKYTQVNDNSGWQSKVLEKYNVEAIPATFLLDKTGMIVAVDLEAKALENKVKQLLK